MPHYKLKPAARLDMEDIWLYGNHQWGAEQANTYARSLAAQFEMLADHPLLCRERSEFNPPARIHHHRRHLIVYTLENGPVVVIRVLHDSMDVEPQLSPPPHSC